MLAYLPEGSRLLYLYDSTSPVLAGDHFRRETMAGRARMQCDEWLGWPMALEDRHASAGRLMVRHERVSAVHTALGEPRAVCLSP